MHIRYRLIQILEIVLWLGAVAGLGMIGRRVWALRDQGPAAMLDAAGPGLLAIGAGMAALLVLIGIYHNSRRSAEAMDRMARQGAGGMRRLPGVARGDAPVAVPAPAPAMVATPAPAPAPVAAVVAPPAPPAPAPVMTPVFSTPALAEPAPAPVSPHVVAAMPEARAPLRPPFGQRRLGPAN